MKLQKYIEENYNSIKIDKDVLHDAYINALQKHINVDNGLAYLRITELNSTRQLSNKNKRFVNEDVLERKQALEQTDEQLICKQQREEIEKALKLLESSPKAYNAFKFHLDNLESNLSSAEVAKLAGAHYESFKTNLRQARLKLKKAYATGQL